MKTQYLPHAPLVVSRFDDCSAVVHLGLKAAREISKFFKITEISVWYVVLSRLVEEQVEFFVCEGLLSYS